MSRIEKGKSLILSFAMSGKSPLLNTAIKLFIGCMLFWVIYRQVILREDLGILWANFLDRFSTNNFPLLLGAILLMPLNWALETQKWRILIRQFLDLSYWRCYKAILAGICISIFTPNRIGEYAGRILFVPARHTWRAIIATLVGSFSQLLVLLGMGLLGLSYFAYHYFDLEIYTFRATIFLGLVLISILIFCFFNIDLLIPLAKRLPFRHLLKKFIRDVSLLKEYTTRQLALTLFYALLRYLCYSLQYYLLLLFFGIKAPLIVALAGISSIYLLQTSLPIMPLLGLFARVEIALFVWRFFSSNDLSILAATFSLWIINLMLPALIGTVFIANINVLKSIGYGDKDA